MTISELIQKLSKYDPNDQVMIQDGVGPRDISSGPFGWRVTPEDADNTADCEDIVGKVVVLIGY